jgi:cell division protein FtsB
MAALEILRLFETYAKDMDRPVVMAVVIVLSIFLFIRRFYESEYVSSGKQQHQELREQHQELKEQYQELNAKYERLETRYEELKKERFEDTKIIGKLQNQINELLIKIKP